MSGALAFHPAGDGAPAYPQRGCPPPRRLPGPAGRHEHKPGHPHQHPSAPTWVPRCCTGSEPRSGWNSPSAGCRSCPGGARRRHRAVKFGKFLVTIDKAVPDDLDIHSPRPDQHLAGSPSPDELVGDQAEELRHPQDRGDRRLEPEHPTVHRTKTADEILNSLAKYLARISGAGH